MNIFLLSLFIIIPAISFADQTVVVESYGENRNDALLHAKRDAVAQGIGSMLSSETEVENFILKKDLVITKTLGSVKRIIILEEKKNADDGSYYVKIQAIVSEDSIKKDLIALQILLEGVNNPRILTLFQNDVSSQGATAVTEYLFSKKIQIVNLSEVLKSSGVSEKKLLEFSMQSLGTLAEIGEKNGADYILLGTVESSSAASSILAETGFHSYQASVTGKIVNCKTGVILASKMAGAAAAHISPERARAKAIEKAAKKMMDQGLLSQLLDSFQDSVNNGFSLYVTIVGVNSYSQSKKIREAIEQTDVMRLRTKNYNNQKLELEARYGGNIESFCDMIDGLKFFKKHLLVSECAGEKVILKVGNAR
ncbi:MAG: hypothetical protein D3903_01415 [Candidatus Electrothrix sp. GM3_4]|nr:hypothetical protein [Candidatus Electrothrix sp. GM3_4]